MSSVATNDRIYTFLSFPGINDFLFIYFKVCTTLITLLHLIIHCYVKPKERILSVVLIIIRTIEYEADLHITIYSVTISDRNDKNEL